MGPVEPGGAEIEAPQSHTVPIELVVGDCPGAERLIGVLDPGETDCSLGGTAPAQWSATGLFEAGSPGVAELLEATPSELGRYCAYDFVGAGEVSNSDYSALIAAAENSPDIDETLLAADCRGEFEQGKNLYDASVGAELRDAFLTNIGWSGGTQLDLDYGNRDHVEVAIVDTVSQAAADDPQIDPDNEHGLQMAALVREVDCPAGRSDCVDQIRHVLVMPRNDISSAPDWVVGGRQGSQGDLAMGIYEAVEAWRERRLADPVGSSPRLVINLSVGWSRLGGEGSFDTTRGPSAAVLAAMNFASCHGALLIGAAGNTPDAACPSNHTGPLAPAAFEELEAPTATECTALGYIPLWTQSYPIFAGSSDYAPLIHAVGGVDEFDEPLLNSRTGGMPRLAALGANGIIDPEAEALSGTSVSAAVTSGTAALIWSYRPELRPDEVMQLIYDAGFDTGVDSDFSLSQSSPNVHRLSVCAAVDDACTGQSGDCPTPSCSATAPALDGNLGGFGSAVQAVLDDPSTNDEHFVNDDVPEAPYCAGETPGLTNLISPQPEIPLCSRCNLFTASGGVGAYDDVTSMTIDPSYAGQITAVNLIVQDTAGMMTTQSFKQAVIDSLNAQPYPVDVTKVSVDAPDAASASLQFWLVDGSMQTNQIPVIEM